VEHVRPQAVSSQVAEGGAPRQLVGAQELSVDHACRLADQRANQVVEPHAACSLGQERQHHESAVVVGEPFAGWKGRRVTVEEGHELLGRRQLVHPYRHQVVADVVDRLLIEVVADPGTM
jgi:hypothetical protein